MNRYDCDFPARCPSDGALISYHLTIRSPTTIMVEAINAACASTGPEFHEAIADRLFAALGGAQVISATHQGVLITTMRGGAESWANRLLPPMIAQDDRMRGIT